jgi:MtN3 and saliva related transmembrane protein
MSPRVLAIVGVATTVISILVKIVGLPDQIRKNYRRKSTSGLSIPFFTLGLVSYGLWTLYGALKGDWVLILGQGVGMLTMGVIAWQIYIYRQNS